VTDLKAEIQGNLMFTATPPKYFGAPALKLSTGSKKV